MNMHVSENSSIYTSCTHQKATQQSNMSSKALVLIVSLLALVSLRSVKAKNWALLVAGSRTYSNYRHQVCCGNISRERVGNSRNLKRYGSAVHSVNFRLYFLKYYTIFNFTAKSVFTPSCPFCMK